MAKASKKKDTAASAAAAAELDAAAEPENGAPGEPVSPEGEPVDPGPEGAGEAVAPPGDGETPAADPPPADQPPPAGDPSSLDGAPIKDDATPALPVRALTAEQRAAIGRASIEDLETAVLRGEADSEFPANWLTEFRQELTRKREAQAKAARMTRQVYYRVTKGGRYVINSQGHNMPVGATVTQFSHNLDDLRRQGIELEEVTGEIVIEETQMGRKVQTIK